MADPMDLSLDDIISTRRSNKRGAGYRSAPRRGGGGRTPYNSRRGKPYARGNADGAWRHDLFESGRSNRNADRMDMDVDDGAQRRVGGASVGESLSVKIENLHWNVVEEDIWELMGTLGNPVKSVKFTYDNAGRSEGIAIVTFTTPQGAQAAIDAYDGRELDGMKMQMALLPPKRTNFSRRDHNQNGGAVSRRLGPKQTSVLERLGKKLEDRLGPRVGGNNRSNGNGRVGGNAPRREHGRPKLVQPTAADLDAQMERYMNNEPEPEPVAPTATRRVVDWDKPQMNGREIISYDDVEVVM